MGNGFGSLYIGASGLQNAQYALNTTANNLANVNTTGYVRQQDRFADKNYNKLKDPNKNVNMQQYGLGVSIGDVVHARDIFLDKSYLQENGRKGFYTSFYEITDYVQDLFQELNGEQFKQSVSDLHQAFQELEPNMDNSTQQNLVLEKADLLLSRTKSLYDDMKSYQSNINEQIKDDVDRVNTLWLANTNYLNQAFNNKCEWFLNYMPLYFTEKIAPNSGSLTRSRRRRSP